MDGAARFHQPGGLKGDRRTPPTSQMPVTATALDPGHSRRTVRNGLDRPARMRSMSARAAARTPDVDYRRRPLAPYPVCEPSEELAVMSRPPDTRHRPGPRRLRGRIQLEEGLRPAASGRSPHERGPESHAPPRPRHRRDHPRPQRPRRPERAGRTLLGRRGDLPGRLSGPAETATLIRTAAHCADASGAAVRKDCDTP